MSKFVPRQFNRLYEDAVAWKEQGSRSKWTTEKSKKLWDTVNDIQRQRSQDLTYFGTSGISAKLSYKEVNEAVGKSMRGGNRLWLHYVDRNGNLTERLVKPTVRTSYGFEAYCFMRGAGRYFAFHSIVDARVVHPERATNPTGEFGRRDCPLCNGFGFKVKEAIDGMAPICECIAENPPVMKTSLKSKLEALKKDFEKNARESEGLHHEAWVAAGKAVKELLKEET